MEMERKEFSVVINAAKEKVWEVLWDVESFAQYTTPFCEGSFVETTWEEGSEVRFLSTDGFGTLAIIRKNDPPDLMLIEIIGIIKDGIVDKSSESAEKWKGAIEKYTLTSEKQGVKLLVEADISDEIMGDFEKAWPQALDIIKRLSEGVDVASK